MVQSHLEELGDLLSLFDNLKFKDVEKLLETTSWRALLALKLLRQQWNAPNSFPPLFSEIKTSLFVLILHSQKQAALHGIVWNPKSFKSIYHLIPRLERVPILLKSIEVIKPIIAQQAILQNQKNHQEKQCDFGVQNNMHTKNLRYYIQHKSTSVGKVR